MWYICEWICEEHDCLYLWGTWFEWHLWFSIVWSVLKWTGLDLNWMEMNRKSGNWMFYMNMVRNSIELNEMSENKNKSLHFILGMSHTYTWIMNEETDRLALPYIVIENDGVVQNPPPEDLPKHVPIVIDHYNSHYEYHCIEDEEEKEENNNE